MAKEVPDESPTCFLPEILNRLNRLTVSSSFVTAMITSSSMCSTYCAMTSQWFLLTTPAPPAPPAISGTCDSRFTWLLRLSLLSFDPPEIDWDDIGIFARSLLKRCFAALYCLGDSRICENPYVWPVPHIWELGICVGPVPQVWQMLRCRRSLDPLYNCYFGFKILWDVWCRKAGVSNTAQTKNTRNEQVFCWLW